MPSTGITRTAKVCTGSGVGNVDARPNAGNWQCVVELESSPARLFDGGVERLRCKPAIGHGPIWHAGIDGNLFQRTQHETHLAKPALLPKLWIVPAHQDALDLLTAMVRADRYGCFNRPVYVESYQAPDGLVKLSMGQAVINLVDIKTTAKTDCQFTLSALGAKDPRCAQCLHKVTPKEAE